jgi:tetratricopeptide (TPR) repeat protein
MSIRNRLRLLPIVAIGLWVLSEVWFLRPARLLGGWDLLSLILAVSIALTIANLFVRIPLKQFRKAVALEDIPAARRELAILVDLYRLRGREMMKTYGISILLVEERYQEALIELKALDMKRLGKKGVPVLTSQIAWCNAHLGEPANAVELVQSVLPQMECMGSEYSSSAHLVLGTADFLLGRPTEAVPHLEKACATESPSRRATAAFYLGESYSALGKTGEASQAYQHSHEALPKGRSGTRALERLK